MSFQIELRSSFASDSPRLVLCIFSSSCSDVPFIMSFNKLVNVEKKKKRVPLDYKNVAHLILRAEPSCLPTCISHQRLILINLFLAYQEKKKKDLE